MNPILPKRLACGLRLSWLDAVTLIVGAVLSWWLHNLSFPLWWIIPAALGHFFLFCNVFLVWRRWELLWAAIFAINVTAHVICGELDPWPPLLWQTPMTLAVIAWQMRSPWYHGVFARQINPHLADYLSAQIAEKQVSSTSR